MYCGVLGGPYDAEKRRAPIRLIFFIEIADLFCNQLIRAQEVVDLVTMQFECSLCVT